MEYEFTPYEKSLLKKVARYCSIQERAVKEVELKLKKSGANTESTSKIISWLEEQNYLNETRFAEIYARSKVRQKRWGRVKIQYELRGKGIHDSEVLEDALNSIPTETYHENLLYILEQKKQELMRKEDPQWKAKLIRYAQSKGYTIEEIYAALESTDNE